MTLFSVRVPTVSLCVSLHVMQTRRRFGYVMQWVLGIQKRPHLPEVTLYCLRNAAPVPMAKAGGKKRKKTQRKHVRDLGMYLTLLVARHTLPPRHLSGSRALNLGIGRRVGTRTIVIDSNHCTSVVYINCWATRGVWLTITRSPCSPGPQITR